MMWHYINKSKLNSISLINHKSLANKDGVKQSDCKSSIFTSHYYIVSTAAIVTCRGTHQTISYVMYVYQTTTTQNIVHTKSGKYLENVIFE